VGEGPANNIQIWDATLMKPVQSLAGHTKNILSVAWSYDDHFIASASEDGTVRIWEASNP
jgi:WD40 repeat protein